MDAGREFKPRILGFLCNWCCYAGADLAGVSRYQYPPNIRIVRLMCSGRVDTAFVLRALARGSDGVFIGGCWLGECHYLTEGNYDALCMMHVCRRMLAQVGVNPDRLRLEWVSASEGIRFAEVITNFTERLQQLGPIGKGEGLESGELKRRLKLLSDLVPYVRLVQAERLRVPERTPPACEVYFGGAEFSRLYQELIGQKIAALLEPRPPARETIDLARVEKILAAYGGRPEMAIQALMEIQRQLGWLPAEALERAAERLNVSLSRLRQIATFYKTFSLLPPGCAPAAPAAEKVPDIYR